MKRLNLNLTNEDYEDFKGFLYEAYENPLNDFHIVEIVLKQLEEKE